MFNVRRKNAAALTTLKGNKTPRKMLWRKRNRHMTFSIFTSPNDSARSAKRKRKFPLIMHGRKKNEKKGERIRLKFENSFRPSFISISSESLRDGRQIIKTERTLLNLAEFSRTEIELLSI